MKNPSMRGLPLLCLIALLAGCGDKVPESRAAKEVGDIPRQTIDKAASGVDAAARQAMERIKEEDKKQ